MIQFHGETQIWCYFWTARGISALHSIGTVWKACKKIQSPTLHSAGRWSERLLLGTPPMCDLDSREREGHLHLKELVPPWICLVSKDFFGKFHTFLSGQVLTFLPNFMKTSSNQRDFIWVHLPLDIVHFSSNKIITVFTNKVYNSK